MKIRKNPGHKEEYQVGIDYINIMNSTDKKNFLNSKQQ